MLTTLTEPQGSADRCLPAPPWVLDVEGYLVRHRPYRQLCPRTWSTVCGRAGLSADCAVGEPRWQAAMQVWCADCRECTRGDGAAP